jgi:hypothetical protein
MSTAGVYGKTFPALRSKAIARVTVGASAPGAPAAERTVVYFRPKEDASSASPSTPSSLADKDLARDSVTVRYETVDGKEARVLLVSTAPAPKVDAAGLRAATANAVARLRALKVTSAEFVVPSLPDAPAPKVAAAIAQAAALANYHFDRYLTTEDKVPTFLESIHISTSALGAAADAAEVEKAVTWAATLADCTVFARDLVNERADEMAPDAIEVRKGALGAGFGREEESPRSSHLAPRFPFSPPPPPSFLFAHLPFFPLPHSPAGRRRRRCRGDRRRPHRGQGRGPGHPRAPPDGRRGPGCEARSTVHRARLQGRPGDVQDRRDG